MFATRLLSCRLSVLALLTLLGPSPLWASTLSVPSAAYPTIQAGIHAALSGDVVLVMDGTYTGPGNMDLDFGGKAITVRSVNGAASTIIDCQGDGSSPHRGFLLDTGSTIDGFTIKNGSAPPVGSSYVGYDARGGGIYSDGGGTVLNCTITHCAAHGIVVYTGSGFGGGIYFDGFGTVTGCTITDCTASGYSGYGGGVYERLSGSGTAAITGCTITGCTASFGGGLYIGSGSGADYPTVANCVIADNTVVTSSSDGSGGGGIYYSGGSTAIVTGTTLTGNSASSSSASGGDFARSIAGAFDFTDCILWNNPASVPHQPDGLIRETNCDSDGLDGIGRINADPLFVDAAGGDFHLQAGSPCLGAGTTVGAPITDGDGGTRPNPPSIGAYEYAPRPLFWTANSLSVGPDGLAHLLWNESTGEAAVWRLDGDDGYLDQLHYGPFAQWTVKSVVTGPDGFTHVLVVNTTGEIALWRLDAQNRFVDQVHYGPFYPIYDTTQVWTASAMSVGPDGNLHLAWTFPNGTTAIWRLDAQNRYLDQVQYGPFYTNSGTTWTLASLATGPDGITRAAWVFPTGEAAIWRLDAQNNYLDQIHYGPFPGWTLRSVTTGLGNVTRLVWTETSGEAAFWRLDAQNRYLDQIHYGPFPQWSVQGLASAPDGSARALWVNITGEIALWRVDGSDNYLDQMHYGPY